jgi:dihydrofolate reductase
VDEMGVFVLPPILGGGKSWLPNGARLTLDLLETRRLSSGAVYLRYGTYS